MFDVKSRIFNTWNIVPPEISYDDFALPYTLCCRENTVLIYYPGNLTLVLDEIRYKWITSLRKLPSQYSQTTSNNQVGLESNLDQSSDDFTYQLQTTTSGSIFILNNSAPYTTSMYEVTESLPNPVCHTPPPIDNITMVTVGYIATGITQIYHFFQSEFHG